MDEMLRNVIKVITVGCLLLIIGIAAFALGFGAAYVLADAGALPIRSAPAPTAPPPTSTPPPGEARPTPTLVPIPTPTNDDEKTFQLFWEVWDLVQRNYYGELPDMQKVTYAAIRGMLNTLGDPYTAFIEPEPAAILAEDASGKFEGIGAYVNMAEDGILEITGVFKDSPAEKAGLQEGDRVLRIDDTPVLGLTLYEAIGLIRGKAGTQVTLLIEREGVAEPFEVTVTRARIEIPTTKVEMREDGVGYIRLYDFSATATKAMRDGLEELLAQNPRGIVFDLRQNPGGWLDQAVNVSDLFLDDGVVLYERWSDGRENVYEAEPGGIAEEIPLVVLVDRGSASASEIVAGALQDHERAILIGETTYGKGSVQRPFTLSDGSELRVTIARWFTPNNRAIHGQGLTPDIEVPWPEEELAPGEDPQLERAVEYLLEGK